MACNEKEFKELLERLEIPYEAEGRRYVFVADVHQDFNRDNVEVTVTFSPEGNMLDIHIE